DHVWLWTGARLRLLFRSEGDASIRRIVHVDVIAVVQRGRRTGTASGSGTDDSRVGIVVLTCGGRTDGNNHPLGNRRPHGMALDDRSLERTASISVGDAGDHSGVPRRRCALDDRDCVVSRLRLGYWLVAPATAESVG